MAIIWTKLIPRWGGDTIEPPEAKKDTGYIAGDKPPAKWENWLRKGTYEALDETRDVIEAIDLQLAQRVQKTGDAMTGSLSITAATRHLDLKPDSESGWAAIAYRNSADVEVWRTAIGVQSENNLSFNNLLGIGELRVDDQRIYHSGNTGGFYTGNGSPEGTITAPIGSIYQRKDGGTNTTLYVKQSGTGNAGWVAK